MLLRLSQVYQDICLLTAPEEKPEARHFSHLTSHLLYSMHVGLHRHSIRGSLAAELDHSICLCNHSMILGSPSVPVQEHGARITFIWYTLLFSTAKPQDPYTLQKHWMIWILTNCLKASQIDVPGVLSMCGESLLTTRAYGGGCLGQLFSPFT